ncbi:hypothetical protein, partial [Nocardia otitidiscaviarum]
MLVCIARGASNAEIARALVI